MTDFLIARSLFEDIRGKDYGEQVSIIKSKAESLDNFEEALIIAIFDSMSPDYKKIKDILIDTELIESLDFNTLVKVHFKRDDITTFLRMLKPIDHSGLLQSMGGYTDKPFNCRKYLFNYYCSHGERLCDLSNTLAGYHFQNGIKNRLKNVLYVTTLNDRADRRGEEAFYFSLACCASPNKDVRCLAMKLLYEVVLKNEGYVDRLIIEQDNFTGKSIRRISTYFGNPYSYIKWNRKNLFKYNKDAVISDYLSDILFYVALMNKDFLPFRYWGKDRIDMHTRFLINDKHVPLSEDFLLLAVERAGAGKSKNSCFIEKLQSIKLVFAGGKNKC